MCSQNGFISILCEYTKELIDTRDSYNMSKKILMEEYLDKYQEELEKKRGVSDES